MTIIGIICVAGGSFAMGIIAAVATLSHIWRISEEQDVKQGYMWHKGKFYWITAFE